MFGLLKKKDTNPIPKGFVKLTRVYGKDKQQPYVLQAIAVESYRPRNKVEGSRCTLVTTSGKYVNVAERFSEVHRLLTQAVL